MDSKKDPWQDKGRDHFSKDAHWLTFQKEKLYGTSFTFEEALELSGITKWKEFSTTDKEEMKSRWTKLSKVWMKHKKTESIPGYAALVYIFVTYPWANVKPDEKCPYTQFYMDNVNFAIFWENDHMKGKNFALARFKDQTNWAEFVLTDTPTYPPAFSEWYDNKYNSASWWITYMVYEQINDLVPIIDSPCVEFISFTDEFSSFTE